MDLYELTGHLVYHTDVKLTNDIMQVINQIFLIKFIIYML